MSDVVRRRFLGKIVEDILRQPRRVVFGQVTAVVWVTATATAAAAADRCSFNLISPLAVVVVVCLSLV